MMGNSSPNLSSYIGTTPGYTGLNSFGNPLLNPVNFTPVPVTQIGH